jgi:hypothetical protein
MALKTSSAVSLTGAAVVLCEIPSTWKTTDKTTLFLQTSALLSGIGSRPGLALCEWTLHQIATPETLTHIFGQNTVFEINPWHPRHLFNVTVNVVAAAALIHVIYQRKTSKPVAGLTAFNFFSGRSTLHLANDAWYLLVNASRA